jgi:exodeoxyribonuclease V beta subunit
LHKGVHDPSHVNTEETTDHEQAVDTPQEVPSHEVPLKGNDVPFAAFPAGAQAGTFLHEIYEHTPFDTTPEQLAELITARAPKHGYSPDTWAEPLSHWVNASLRSSLGGPLGDDSLSNVSDEERLDELEFDFTIGNTLGVNGEKLCEVFLLGKAPLCLPDDYTKTLQTLRFPNMAGLLTGSIDLVFRKRVNGHPMWFVADYKSNRLDPFASRTYPQENFAKTHMQTAMNEHHYHLQYCLYTLAIHRYLRLRVATYDYERDFGGVYYLFIRGMTGDADHGSYFRRPPVSLIDALDKLFSEGS